LKLKKKYQSYLNTVLNVSMVVDGIIGPKTETYICAFQYKYGLPVNGLLTSDTRAAIRHEHRKIISKMIRVTNPKFAVFVDAGHGGLDDEGIYRTTGKRAFHEGLQLHQAGHYYEGHENRIIAERFIQQLTSAEINAIRVYHPYFDTPLSRRASNVKYWLNRGYYGYLHSFHSNAIESEDFAKLRNTIGFQVYTTKGQTLSDTIASWHYENTKIRLPNWKYLKQSYIDGDVDYEANFKILTDTDTQRFEKFGAILEEFGFHSSSRDCKFIVQEETRAARVDAALATAVQVMYHLENKAV